MELPVSERNMCDPLYSADLASDNTWIGLNDMTSEGSFKWTDNSLLAIDG